MVIHIKHRYKQISNKDNFCRHVREYFSCNKCPNRISEYYIIDGNKYDKPNIHQLHVARIVDKIVECKLENLKKAQLLADKLK